MLSIEGNTHRSETNTKMSTLATPALSLEDLRPPFRKRLKSMYSGELQPGTNGPVELDKLTRISEPQGMWIYETHRRLKPNRSLEVGLAYGFSTIYILAAIDRTGAGHHTALDPFQQNSWHGVGALQAKHLGMEPSFQMLEEFSIPALARFATQKVGFELIYIDGNHKFDDVFVDFTLAAEVCPLGGNIILDDMWMPSVQTAVSWIRSNRTDFREISTPIDNIAQFERIDEDRRAWDHFVRFGTPDSGTQRSSISTRIARRVKRMLAK
jgi:predicted O-methyltransferase YrrM